METMTLERIHEDILSLKKDMQLIKEHFEGEDLELCEEVKEQIIKSRKRSRSEFLSQKDIENKFL